MAPWEWTADDWTALGTMLLGIGALTAGGWTLFNFRQSKRRDAAQWLRDSYADFYLDERFSRSRIMLDWDYSELAPLLVESQIGDGESLSENQRMKVHELDMMLKYLDHMIYLEDLGQISERDRVAMFGYWYDLIASDKFEELRKYIRAYGFERLVAVTDSLRAVSEG